MVLFKASLHGYGDSVGLSLFHRQTYLHQNVHNYKGPKQRKPDSPYRNWHHCKKEPQADVDESQNKTEATKVFVEYFPDKATFGLDTILIGRVRTAITNIPYISNSFLKSEKFLNVKVLLSERGT